MDFDSVSVVFVDGAIDVAFVIDAVDVVLVVDASMVFLFFSKMITVGIVAINIIDIPVGIIQMSFFFQKLSRLK